MGVDINVILEHQLSFFDIIALPRILNSDAQLRDASAGLQKGYLERPSATGEMNWVIERDPLYQSPEQEWRKTGCLSLYEANGLGSLHVHLAAEYNPLARWSAFLMYPHVREPIQLACAAIVRHLRGSQCIYLCDSGPHEMATDMVAAGESMASVWGYVQQAFGHPRSDYENAMDWPENAYAAEAF